ncbi:flagellar export chaperone FliS [Colwellia sp. Arc7-635]|jgi:flagellar protein FliS|uniref:flagellar export chaperone FliS n=1 Tax=Colwellia sp. Arc7-635 TaxID=2497879 RepID=UPI000F857C41|nr:flagellar export chaperone FliS [Colwellia sp. Arc7-635]AZQ85520.1 flagellar export chaperone FliS [Colwellia sp. Arc7-635]
MRQNLKAYKQVDVNSSLLESNPHQIILMMFDGMLQGIAVAKGAIERKDYELKSKSITKAINILEALRKSLDFESQPEISDNFDIMYSYCIDRLADISVSLDVSAFPEVVGMLKPLRDAWFAMPESSKQEGLSLLSEKNKLAEGA